MEFNYINRPRKKEGFGDKMALATFKKLVCDWGIQPSHGMVGDVLVDGRPTDISIIGWDGGWGGYGTRLTNVYLSELDEIEGEVTIVWCE